MIRIFNPDRLTRQPFFQSLINYLDTHDDVILRQIRRDFPEVKHLERQLEDYVQAGYILRQDRRYSLNLPFLEKAEQASLDQMVFLQTDSLAYQDLMTLRFETRLGNSTNEAILLEQTGFDRTDLTLANYFYKLRAEEPISSEQEPLYAILGDVNPDYALKYMTSFLLKFARKDLVKQRRQDIFVEGLRVLGYIDRVDEETYALKLSFDRDRLVFKAID